jgi:hypothetical protein
LLSAVQSIIGTGSDLLKTLSSKGFASYFKIYNLATLDAKAHIVDILARLVQSCSQPIAGLFLDAM